MNFNKTSLVIALAAATTSMTWAQSIISAKSGVINYYEGDVLAGGKAIEVKNGKFAEWQKGQDLTTGEGRAEILLTPGVFLRVSENSKLVMTENRLSDTRIQVIQGSVLLECAELLQDNSVALTYGDFTLAVRKAGLYRLDTESGTAKVYEGEWQIAGNGQTMLLKKGKLTQLGSLLVASKFDSKVGDSFYRWAARRAEPLSVASFSGARSVYTSGVPWGYGGWYFNPYFGMFTYLPFRGYYNSPFGYRFYSPVVINNVYNNLAGGYGGYGGASAYNRGGNNGYNTWNHDTFYDSGRGYGITTRGNVGSGGGFSGGGTAIGGGGGGGAVAPAAPAAGRGDMGGGGSGRGDSGAGSRGK